MEGFSEQAAAAQRASKMVPVTRTGSRRGRRGAAEQGPDGWNVAGPTPVRAPAKAGDLSNFGKFTANAGPLKTMGLSSVFKKVDRGRDTPQQSAPSTLSRATSGGNMFSLLGAAVGADAVDTMPKKTPSGRDTTRKPSGDQVRQVAADTPLRRKLQLLPRSVAAGKDGGAGDDKPESDEEQAPAAALVKTLRRKLQLLPRSVTAGEDGGAGDDKPESDEEQAPTAAAPVKTYTDQQAKARVEEDIKEFFNVRDVSEGEKSFAELPEKHKSKLVDKFASRALDSKDADVKLVADVFKKAASSKSCSPAAFEDGLAGIIEFLDDTATDVPQAYTIMAKLLRGTKLPQETVESLADKIYVDGDPLVRPKDKLLKAYAALA